MGRRGCFLITSRQLYFLFEILFEPYQYRFHTTKQVRPLIQ